MRRTLWFFVVCIALAGVRARAEDHLDSLATTDGKTYSDVTVKRSDPSGIDIVYDIGAAHIAFEKLSPELQKKYGYDPIKAQEFAKQQALLKTQAEAQEAVRVSLDEIIKTKAALIFPAFKVGSGYILSTGYTWWGVGFTPWFPGNCIVTEVDTSSIATGENWRGNVYRVGTETIEGERYAHYTADLQAWAKSQGIALGNGSE